MNLRIQTHTDDELLALLNDLESDLAERKESFKGDTPDRARQAVCAFANDLPNYDRPGVLFIGAKDNGDPSGITVDDRLLSQIGDMRTDGNILPPPLLTVQKRNLKGADMIVVSVYPSDAPPVKYKGRIWIRIGPRRAIATAQEERILNEKRRHKNVPFDISPVSMASIDDLSRTIFENEYLQAAFAPDILEENHRTYEERLSSCKMIVSPDDPTPTILGVLSLGKSPQDFIPGAFVQFLRIMGSKIFDPVSDEEEIKGSFINVIRRTEDKFKAYNHTAVDISQGRHRVTMDYPAIAFQQILYNAVMHRTYEGTNAPVRVYWYNDRIEINSPGGPFGNVTVENFGKPGITDYRNPNIADVFKTFGFVQRYGMGIQSARNALEKNGNPPLGYDINESIIVGTLRIGI
jgi:ATP-dependent DNA helicase RecG